MTAGDETLATIDPPVTRDPLLTANPPVTLDALPTRPEDAEQAVAPVDRPSDSEIAGRRFRVIPHTH